VLVVADALDAFYLGSFLFGLLFSAVTCLCGLAHVGGHGAPTHGLGGGHGDDASLPAAHTHVKPASPKQVNVPLLIAFVSWFGGVGYPSRNALDLVTPVSLVCGLTGGVAAAATVAWFLARVVAPNDVALDAADFALPGVTARVSSPIRAGGTGEIVYELGGTRRVSAARGEDAGVHSRGETVRITRTDRGVAYVGRPPDPGPPVGLPPR
jgi:hypothetical protein